MSGHDELIRQLRTSVRELGERRDAQGDETAAAHRPPPRDGVAPSGDHAPRSGAAPSGDGARRRGATPSGGRRGPLRGRRRGLLVALIAVVVGGGVATAAQTGVLPVARHGDRPVSARQLAFRAVQEAQKVGACRPVEPGKAATTELAPIDGAVRSLFSTPPDAVAMRIALAINHGGPVVAGSARRVVLPGPKVMVLWVSVGAGPGAPADPAACGQARLAQVARDRPDPNSRLRRKAEAILRGYRDTIPGLQTLEVVLRRGRPGGGSGTGIPLDGRAMPIGIVGGSGDDSTGLAAPGATRVTVDGRALHRRFAVRDGVFVVTLPHGTGPVRLRQRAADGRVLARETLRG
jgi:hypothetical protein